MNQKSGSGSTAVITGYGPGLGMVLAERLQERGCRVAALSRSGNDTGVGDDGIALSCDMADPDAVATAFATIRQKLGDPDILIHNAARLMIADFAETSPEDFETVWRVVCLGAMTASSEVLPAMSRNGTGTILFTGATASVKGGARFSAFASAKFALRGLAQSLARAYGPKGVHVAHTIIDGVIWGDRAEKSFGMDRTDCMEPEPIGKAYLSLIDQPRSAWTHEIDLRPFGEAF